MDVRVRNIKNMKEEKEKIYFNSLKQKEDRLKSLSFIEIYKNKTWLKVCNKKNPILNFAIESPIYIFVIIVLWNLLFKKYATLFITNMFFLIIVLGCYFIELVIIKNELRKSIKFQKSINVEEYLTNYLVSNAPKPNHLLEDNLAVTKMIMLNKMKTLSDPHVKRVFVSNMYSNDNKSNSICYDLKIIYETDDGNLHTENLDDCEVKGKNGTEPELVWEDGVVTLYKRAK